MSVFSEEQIRAAIEAFQKSHPLGYGIDCSRIDSLQSLDILNGELDGYLKKCQKDSEMYIICEMARLFLDGVRPCCFDEEQYKKAYTEGFEAGIQECIRRIKYGKATNEVSM